MTRKEIVATFRKEFNSFIRKLPDVEYETMNYSADEIPPSAHEIKDKGLMYTAEFGAEEKRVE